MYKGLLLIICAIPAMAGSICYPRVNILTAADYLTANNWASTSGGAAASCAAAGGTGLAVYGAAAATIPAHVPGAAGSHDAIYVLTGITVHIPQGIGLELGNPTYAGGPDAFHVYATNATTYGALIVDQGGLILTHGGSSSGQNYGIIDQYAVFQVAPGGVFWIGSAQNGPLLKVSGRVYIGCGDQAVYPSPACSGNAGSWVTASVGSTLNLTAASALPAGLAVNDLIELDPIPQPLAFAYPYAIDGVTPPPAPPILPVTSDTGTSPMQTCGSASTCKLPASMPMCVVAISGSSISVGWPHGTWASTTNKLPYCDGTETAAAISNAGSGSLWLKKVAFFGGDPRAITWTTAQTYAPSGNIEQMDGVRSSAAFPGAPISNAAGTGIGRYGDNSWTVSSSTWPASCTALTVDAVTTSGCYIDWNTGQLTTSGYRFTFTGSVSYKVGSPTTYGSGNATAGSVSFPSLGACGTTCYQEFVVQNADVEYLYEQYAAPFVQVKNLTRAANHNFAFGYNTVRQSRNLIGMMGASGSSSAPIEINHNSIYGSSTINSFVGPFVNFYNASAYIDISHNFLNDTNQLAGCRIFNGYTSALQTFDHITDVNNQVLGVGWYWLYDNSDLCDWTNRLSADNRITMSGSADGGAGFPSYYTSAYGVSSAHSSTANNVFKYNYIYAGYRGFYAGSGQAWSNNFLAFNWHHVFTVSPFDTPANIAGGGQAQAVGLQIDHNIFASYSNQQLPCADTGYNQGVFVDGMKLFNNTCLIAGGSGDGIMIGDTDSASYTGLAGMQVYNNAFGPTTTYGMAKGPQNGANMMQHAMAYAGGNSMQGTAAMFGAYAPNSNNIPNWTYHTDVAVTKGVVNYNTSGSRSITGVTIQNPTYTSTQTGCLRYNFTDRSNITMAWSADCTNYTASPMQLNWGGASTTYTVSSLTAGADAGSEFAKVAVTGTPFVAIGASTATPISTSCPVGRWVWMLTGSSAGTAFPIMDCPGTTGAASNALIIITGTATNTANPSPSISAGDTFAIVKWEVNLLDAGGTNSVDIGIDARSLPTSVGTLIDSEISMTPSDYCTGTCAGPSVIAGLPSTLTTGVTNAPLLAIPMPLNGGSAEQALCNGAALCGGTAYYQPTGTAWRTSGFLGGYIGAVSPPTPSAFIKRRLIQ